MSGEWAHLFGWLSETVIAEVKVRTPFPKITGGIAVYDAPQGYGLISARTVEVSAQGRTDWTTRLLGEQNLDFDAEYLRERMRDLFETVRRCGGAQERDYRRRAEDFAVTMLDYLHAARRTHARLELPYACAHDGDEQDRRGGALHLQVHGAMIKLITRDGLHAIIAELIEEIAHGVPPHELDGACDLACTSRHGSVFDRRRDLPIELPGLLRIQRAV